MKCINKPKVLIVCDHGQFRSLNLARAGNKTGEYQCLFCGLNEESDVLYDKNLSKWADVIVYVGEDMNYPFQINIYKRFLKHPVDEVKASNINFDWEEEFKKIIEKIE